MMKKLIVLLCLLQGGCATKSLMPIGADGAVIKIEHEPAYMSRMWYSLELSSDGRGQLKWSTNQSTFIRVGKFRVSQPAFTGVEDQLRALRPAGNRFIDEDDPKCGSYSPDQGAIHVTWSGRGPLGHLRYDYGCDNVLNLQLVKTLEAAPLSVVPVDLRNLPIWKMVNVY